MSLPKVATPTFELVQPSTGEKLTYRPFLVKEEKILLIAKESDEKRDVFNAIKQVINNCVLTEEFDVNTVPIFDMEYIFLKLRAVSVNNVVNFVVEDSDDEIEYKLELDLNEVEVIFPDGHDKKIEIDEEMGMMLKYPTPDISDRIANLKTIAEITYETIQSCVDYVYDAEEVYPWDQSSKKERDEFMDSLPVEVYDKIQKFFETAPRIEHVVKYKNSNGDEKRVVFRDLDDFFTLY